MTPISSSSPKISVIVPTYDRPEPLARCLSLLAAQDYPREQFEVIVVDDGGSTDLNLLTGELQNVHVIRQRNAGPAAARNTGACAAQNDVLAFIDDDCAPRTNWLSLLAAALERHPGALVGGRTHNALAENLCAVASQSIIDTVHAHFNSDPQRATFFPSDNIAVSRQRFLDIGGFDTSFRWSEDRDLCDRWIARGWPLVSVPDAIVDHAHVMGLIGFFKQHLGYGRGAWRYHRARADRGTGQLKPEGSFYLSCFRAPFRTQPIHRAIALAVLMSVWQIANTCGFVFQALYDGRSKRKWASTLADSALPPGRTSHDRT
jgi:glycosyltransferase involved in cell wall biosynthesis